MPASRTLRSDCSATAPPESKRSTSILRLPRRAKSRSNRPFLRSRASTMSLDFARPRSHDRPGARDHQAPRSAAPERRQTSAARQCRRSVGHRRRSPGRALRSPTAGRSRPSCRKRPPARPGRGYPGRQRVDRVHATEVDHPRSIAREGVVELAARIQPQGERVGIAGRLGAGGSRARCLHPSGARGRLRAPSCRARLMTSTPPSPNVGSRSPSGSNRATTVSGDAASPGGGHPNCPVSR